MADQKKKKKKKHTVFGKIVLSEQKKTKIRTGFGVRLFASHIFKCVVLIMYSVNTIHTHTHVSHAIESINEA